MNKVRLARRSVDALAPQEKRYYVWDTQISGFGVKVLPSGRKTYVYKYRVGGGRGSVEREPVIGADGTITPDGARAVAKQWAAKVALGEDPGTARNKDRNIPNVADLLQRYLTDHAEIHKKASSVEEDRSMIRDMLQPAFGRTKVKDLARPNIARWHSKLKTTPYRANRALALLSKALNLAEIWGLRDTGSNPCRHIKKFKEEKRERFLNAEEFGRLLRILNKAEAGDLLTGKGNVVSPIAAAAIHLIALTGARRSEILGLQWDWIDFDQSLANLPDSKTGRRKLYFDANAIDLLKRQTQFAENPFVFPGMRPNTHLADVKRSWALIRQAAEISDFRLHDLRHSYASVGAAMGLSLPQIGALLGHKSPQTTARYAHLLDSVQHASAAEIGAKISGSG